MTVDNAGMMTLDETTGVVVVDEAWVVAFAFVVSWVSFDFLHGRKRTLEDPRATHPSHPSLFFRTYLFMVWLDEDLSWNEGQSSPLI